MDLHEAFRDQAHALMVVDKTKPKPINLRRSVSAAYYAVFHLLVAEATARVVGAKTAGAVADDLRAQVTRWYGHAEMKRACEWFAGTGKVPETVRALLGTPPNRIVPDKLERLAATFVMLQEARHRADYDISDAPTRSRARLLVEAADLAFEDVAALRGDPVYYAFLALLLTGDRVVKTR